MKVPYLDLSAQHRALRGELHAAVMRVLDNTSFVLGPEVAAFEAEFAAHQRLTHPVAVNSGTSGLHLALLAAGVGPGDEVITVPFTFIATLAAVGYAGARPVLVDVEPAGLTIDPARIEAAITPRTRAILPVHLYGQCAAMAPVNAIARRHGLKVIEDAAQAHDATQDGTPAGALGDLGVFSFYPTKNLGAAGEGGLVTTADPAAARTLRMLRDWGAERKYHHELRGFNYRMEGVQAAVLRVKLPHLRPWTEARIRIAGEYLRRLAGLPITLPVVLPGNRHVWHVFCIRTPRRDELAAWLADRGIGTGVHYPVPAHLQPAWADLGYGAGSFPVSEQAAREVLALPCHPDMTDAQVDHVVRSVREWAGG